MLIVEQAAVWMRRLLLVVMLCASGTSVLAAELWIGRETVSITPDRPVALAGQMRTRIARDVESPVTATVLVLESRDGEESLDQAVMVSCDLVAIRGGFVEAIRENLRDQLPDLDVEKIFFGATHTHTAPVMIEGRYDVDDPEVITPTEYTEFAAERIGEAITRAWTERTPGAVGWGLGHAVVAYNRRIVYTDGQAQMYGRTNRSDFRRIEGYEDHGVEVLFFWDAEERLIATVVNVACPAQVVEGRSAVNADFWHPVRETLREKYGEDLVILGFTGAAGDQSPRPMFRKEAEQRMRRLRGVTELEELSRRIVHAWEEAYEGASKEIHRDVPLAHRVRRIPLTPREITTEEYAQALEKIAALEGQPDNRWRLRWHQGVVDRYEQQRDGTAEPYEMELHVVRLGDVALATNDFELFTDFGIQIKARSQAVQTFLVQLAGPGTYVPTQRAVRGGGYSAIPESNKVGPQGGQELVEQTIELINSLF